MSKGIKLGLVLLMAALVAGCGAQKRTAAEKETPGAQIVAGTTASGKLYLFQSRDDRNLFVSRVKEDLPKALESLKTDEERAKASAGVEDKHLRRLGDRIELKIALDPISDAIRGQKADAIKAKLVAADKRERTAKEALSNAKDVAERSRLEGELDAAHQTLRVVADFEREIRVRVNSNPAVVVAMLGEGALDVRALLQNEENEKLGHITAALAQIGLYAVRVQITWGKTNVNYLSKTVLEGDFGYDLASGTTALPLHFVLSGQEQGKDGGYRMKDVVGYDRAEWAKKKEESHVLRAGYMTVSKLVAPKTAEQFHAEAHKKAQEEQAKKAAVK